MMKNNLFENINNRSKEYIFELDGNYNLDYEDYLTHIDLYKQISFDKVINIFKFPYLEKDKSLIILKKLVNRDRGFLYIDFNKHHFPTDLLENDNLKDLISYLKYSRKNIIVFDNIDYYSNRKILLDKILPLIKKLPSLKIVLLVMNNKLINYYIDYLNKEFLKDYKVTNMNLNLLEYYKSFEKISLLNKHSAFKKNTHLNVLNIKCSKNNLLEDTIIPKLLTDIQDNKKLKENYLSLFGKNLFEINKINLDTYKNKTYFLDKMFDYYNKGSGLQFDNQYNRLCI